MKGCCFQDVQQVSIDSVDDPAIKNPDEAIVQVEMAGLCGSDLHPFFGEKGIDCGTVMGHEFVGKVISKGSSVDSVQVGDRVACPFTTSCGICFYCQSGLTSRCDKSQLFGWREKGSGLHGGQAEYVLVPDADGSLVPIDESISNEMAILLGDNLSTGFFCAEMAGVNSDGVYLIIGCGTVGLLSILAASRLGAKKIVAYDPLPDRLRLAEEFGARVFSTEESTITEIRQLTRNRGADGVMELVGLLPAQKFAMQAVRPGGIISTIGCHCTPDFGFSPADVYDKNLTYRSGRCPARFYMGKLMGDLGNLDVPIEKLISHRFDLNNCKTAYDVFSNKKDGCVKAVFELN